MTDWVPWGLVLMVWVGATLGLLVRAVDRAPTGSKPDLGPVRRAFLIGGIATLVAFLLYVVFQERWIWY